MTFIYDKIALRET